MLVDACLMSLCGTPTIYNTACVCAFFDHLHLCMCVCALNSQQGRHQFWARARTQTHPHTHTPTMAMKWAKRQLQSGKEYVERSVGRSGGAHQEAGAFV